MAELQEVDIEKELAKSDSEDIPSLSIKTEPLDDSNIEEEVEQNINKSNMTQKELLASLIEGSPDKSSEEKSSPLEEGEVDETQLSKSPLEEGEVDETQLPVEPIPAVSLEIGEIPEEELSKTSQIPDIATIQLSKSLLEDGEIDETKLNIESVEDESSDEEDDNLFYRNLEEDIDSNILKFYHPETENINYKELLTLSNITKNKKGEIIDPFHKTIPYLTQYEKAKILGQRAKQINHGSTPFVEVPSNIIDGHTIALMELNQQKIPFIIRRPLPNGVSEYWRVKDLKIL